MCSNQKGKTMLFPILIIVGVISLIGGFVAGRIVGGQFRMPTTPLHQNDPNPAACQDACTQWDIRRSERCGLEADEEVARRRADALRTELGMALAVAAALLAAAIGLSVIPIYGWAAATIPFAAAAIASVAASYIGGLLQQAEAHVLNMEQATRDGRERETNARSLVRQLCSPVDAAACLSVPGPC